MPADSLTTVHSPKAESSRKSNGVRMDDCFDLTGCVFDRWTVLGKAKKPSDKAKGAYWHCSCACGNTAVVRGSALRNRSSRSCRCLNTDNHLKTHGSTQTREYKIWVGIKGRCLNRNCKCYARYGGRGITLSNRWLRFENFIEDMGRRPGKGYSIERTDNSKGYSKENCKWATALEQGNNTRINVFFEFSGKKLTLAQWARELSLPWNTLKSRRRYGWPIERILTVPIKTRHV